MSWKKSHGPYFEPILIWEYFRKTILDLWQMSQQLSGDIFALPKVKVTALFFWKHYFQRWKEKLDPNCSHTLVTVVIPLLPAYDRYCLHVWDTGIMRVTHLLCCCMWHRLQEVTYVLDHLFPAHSAPCSCRMGIFVKRWSSFYACHWMTVKEKRHGAKTGTSNCCHTHADKTTSL